MKFKYLDKVKIVSGFFRGYKGTLVGAMRDKKGTVYYDVEVEKVNPRTKIKHITVITIREKDLEKVKKRLKAKKEAVGTI